MSEDLYIGFDPACGKSVSAITVFGVEKNIPLAYYKEGGFDLVDDLALPEYSFEPLSFSSTINLSKKEMLRLKWFLGSVKRIPRKLKKEFKKETIK